jgi:hypothetical protein
MILCRSSYWRFCEEIEKMQKNHHRYLVSALLVAAMVMGAIGVNFAFAHGAIDKVAPSQSTISAKAVSSNMVTMQVVNMPNHQSPAGIKMHAGQRTSLPILTTVKKQQASNITNAPQLTHAYTMSHASMPITPDTPHATSKFQGMADSALTCPYFGGCQPPDMALASSPQWVLQGVNTSIAVYNTSGQLQSGWPINSQQFFNIPNPPNNCDPSGPYTSDPRAFYDINDQRFWVAMLQVEGAFGIAPNCPFQSDYWIAVSQSSDPNGAWNVYEFEMSLGSGNAADYTQFGFDAHAIYYGANMFNAAGSAYEYDEIFGVNKQMMEAGQSVTAYGFTQLSAGGVLVDTVQPVEAEVSGSGGPGDALFINSFNMNGDPNGDNCYTTACSGLVVWAMSNPGMQNAKLTGVEVATASYISPPNADEPGCSQCVETIDNRITGTPPFADGQISFSLDTAVQNKTQVVPAIFWGQVTPQIANGKLTGAVLYQSGYFGFKGDQDASFGALMPDVNGNLIMVYDTMSSSINPGAVYAARRATFTFGEFHDAGRFLQKGLAPTSDSRWGDYEATSYDGFSSNHIWFASQYSSTNEDWATAIGVTQFQYV